MFDHVTIRVADRAESERFYGRLLATLGQSPTNADAAFVEWDAFGLAAADAEHPVTRNLHVAFFAPTRELVHEFWQAGLDAGYRDDGAPGPRPQYGPDYYGGFLRDPDGNSVEAVNNESGRRAAAIDHLWIRVADVGAARAFYRAVAPHAGFELGDDTPERVQFRAEAGSCSFVAGTPTEHVHLAFPAPDRGAVDAFHAAAVAAGYADNGAPGERPEYHPGYYAAFVLDPDGNNVEVVHHDRSAGG